MDMSKDTKDRVDNLTRKLQTLATVCDRPEVDNGIKSIVKEVVVDVKALTDSLAGTLPVDPVPTPPFHPVPAEPFNPAPVAPHEPVVGVN